jgi:hypothetical protein
MRIPRQLIRQPPVRRWTIWPGNRICQAVSSVDAASRLTFRVELRDVAKFLLASCHQILDRHRL